MLLASHNVSIKCPLGSVASGKQRATNQAACRGRGRILSGYHDQIWVWVGQRRVVKLLRLRIIGRSDATPPAFGLVVRGTPCILTCRRISTYAARDVRQTCTLTCFHSRTISLYCIICSIALADIPLPRR